MGKEPARNLSARTPCLAKPPTGNPDVSDGARTFGFWRSRFTSDMAMGRTSRQLRIERSRGRNDRNQRICGFEGCSTVLSSYNRSTRCWLHEELLDRAMAPSASRGKKPHRTTDDL